MAKLKRSVNWKVFSLYGLGNILGAGIYVLVGEVASVAGNGLLWSFLIAGFVASFTVITYSAFASKYPVSAGAAVYSNRAFGSKLLSTIIGLSLAFTGVVSASALLHGFDRYFQQLLSVTSLNDTIPSQVVILVLIGLLSLIAFKGIKESAVFAVVLTIIEAIGLALIIGFAGLNGDFVGSLNQSVEAIGTVEPMAIFLGGFLAFYAFIGFEDMVNIAEEVKEPKKSIKKGMITALIGATILYVLTAIAALAVLSVPELASSRAPLATVFQVASGSSLPIITVIGLFAVTNGVLAQIIMSSRVLYGLAREGWLPKVLGNVSIKTQTPIVATVVAVVVIAIGALILPLVTLAKITSFALLIIFSVVQIAAIRLILKKQLKLFIAIPIIGFVTNIAILTIQVLSWFGQI